MFVIIKPDAVSSGVECEIIALIRRVSGAGLVGAYKMVMHKGQAACLYEEHTSESWFHDLCAFMCSGPCILVEFEGTDRVIDRALVNEIRALYGKSTRHNAIHAPRTIKDQYRESEIFDDE